MKTMLKKYEIIIYPMIWKLPRKILRVLRLSVIASYSIFSLNVPLWFSIQNRMGLVVHTRCHFQQKCHAVVNCPMLLDAVPNLLFRCFIQHICHWTEKREKYHSLRTVYFTYCTRIPLLRWVLSISAQAEDPRPGLWHHVVCSWTVCDTIL